MKMNKLAAASLLAMSFAGYASAQQIINIVGSTAFRSFVTQAEFTVASHASTSTATSPVAGTPDGAYVEKSFSANGTNGSTHSLIHGYLVDGTEVYYRNYWTGSLSGVLDESLPATTDQFIPTSATRSSINGANSGTVYSGAYDSTNFLPNVTMTDAQAADCAACLAGTFPASASAISAAPLVNAGVTAGPKSTVGLVTFQWVIGKLSTGSEPFTNITAQQASALVANGIEPLSLFTGNTSDATNYVVFIGRNEDSGTRILTFGESQGGGISGYGWDFGQSCTQFMIQQAGESTTYYNNGYPRSNGATIAVGTSVQGFKPWPSNWPLNTESSLNWSTTGHSGYTGGGDVSSVLQTPLNPTTSASFVYQGVPAGFVAGTSKVYIVSCLGCSDAASAVAGGATALTYNGVGYNAANTGNIAAGQYTLWNFEHCYYVTSGSNAIGANQEAADALADQIYATPTSTLAPVGVNYGDLTGFTRSFKAGTSPQ